MKTSVIEVRDMLSVLSVSGVEKRIGEVGGVESVTVNYAAGSATVRYDETRLDISDIKSNVRQSGYDDDAPPGGSAAHGHDAQAAPAAEPSASAKPPSPASGGITAGPTPSTNDAAATPDAAPPGDASKGKTAPAAS